MNFASFKFSLHHYFTHSKFWVVYVQHQSSVPGWSQDDVRLDPVLPYWPASYYFGSSASVPQNPKYEHRYSTGQNIQTPQHGWICESMSSSCGYTGMPLSLSFLPLHITFEESWGWANLTPSWDAFLGTLFIHDLFHTFVTWTWILISWFFWRTLLKHTSIYVWILSNKLGLSVVVEQHNLI